MTRSWFADLSALEMVPDAGPDGPGPLSRIPLAVGRWSTAPGPSGGRGVAVRVVDPADPAPAGLLPDFPLVPSPDAPGGFRLLEVTLTTQSGDPAVDVGRDDAADRPGPGAPTWP